jgi:hypothetical protein
MTGSPHLIHIPSAFLVSFQILFFAMSNQSQLTIYDILIIGGGPCGLAVAARLSESTPSALFTDDEHQRYHWMKKHFQATMTIKNRKTGRVKTSQLRHPSTSLSPSPPSSPESLPSETSMSSDDTSTTSVAEEFESVLSEDCLSNLARTYDGLSMLVLDASGAEWMKRWNTLFAALEIHHLRSPMFFHIDPSDRDGLLVHVHEQEFLNSQGRGSKAPREENMEDMLELKGCVGKEVSKHAAKKRWGGKRQVSCSGFPHLTRPNKQSLPDLPQMLK